MATVTKPAIKYRIFFAIARLFRYEAIVEHTPFTKYPSYYIRKLDK